MSEPKKTPGSIGWIDLTVDDATGLKPFYEAVCGWTTDAYDMGECSDWVCKVDGEAIAGICHARGPNVGIPPQWLMYVTVQDVQRSTELVRSNGGTVLQEPAEGRPMAIVKDPAGVVFALYGA